MQAFLNSRKGDKRTNIVTTETELMYGDFFISPALISRRSLNHFIINIKINIMLFIRRTSTQESSGWRSCRKKHPKRRLLLQLKQKLACDRLVVFGDGKNDIDMFKIADEAYAVENAVSELKAVATGIIGSNENDGVGEISPENIYFQINCFMISYSLTCGKWRL